MNVTVDEWSLRLNASVVNAGGVSFHVINAGHEVHELVILKSDVAPDQQHLRHRKRRRMPQTTRLMSSMLYDISPRDPLTFGLVPLVLVAAALAASFFPARRATLVEPVEALRTD